jgi:ATP-dependent helicase YprA (DUF1998 family)
VACSTRDSTQCLVKMASKTDPDMLREFEVLRKCREKDGKGIITGDGKEYYLGKRDQSERLVFVFRVSPPDSRIPFWRRAYQFCEVHTAEP